MSVALRVVLQRENQRMELMEGEVELDESKGGGKPVEVEYAGVVPASAFRFQC
jgi:hypothetical protein